jgi:DNA polymerase-4
MNSAPHRTLLHADMDAFFAAVEQRDRPELRGKPVIVGGTGNRGVVTAASYEARRYGVHSAMPTGEARRLCPDGIYLRGDLKRYASASRDIFEIFRRFSPRVEGLSLDEAFLDLTGSERLLGPARSVAERLRREMRDEVGLVVSVGIAPVKMVAKIASGESKPDGLLEITPDGVRAFLDPLHVGRIWGVGPVAQGRLASAGFETIGDLARADSTSIEAALGDWGVGLRRLARGEDIREVEAYRQAVSYSEENTFSRDVTDRGTLDATILVHAEAVARRLRKDGVAARTVTLKLKLARRHSAGPRGFPILTRRVTLPEATNDGDLLTRAARTLLTRAGISEPLRLVGVGATNLVPSQGSQLSLFSEPEPQARRKRLNHALDEITERFGSGAVHRGAVSEAERAGLSSQIKRGES